MALGMSLTAFRKQFTVQSFYLYKRFFYMSSVLKDPKLEHAMATDEQLTQEKTRKQKKKTHRNKKQTASKEVFKPEENVAKQEETILNFFNCCDHVTLKNLLARQKSKHQPPALKEILIRDVLRDNKTFKDIQEFLEQTSAPKSYLTYLYDSIKKLEAQERTTFGFPSILPKIPLYSTENVEYTVTLDIFLNNLNWAVMNRNRELLDVGSKELFEKQYVYHPVRHHEMVQDILNTVPPSNLYIFCSNIQPRKGNRYYQTLMEALLKLTLNHRMNLLLKNKKKWQTEFKNFVYQVTYSDLNLFHKILSNGELEDLHPIVDQFKRYNSGPLQGMRTEVDLDDVNIINNNTIKCILLADATCRCLNKKNDNFPAAYFPPDS